MSGIVSGATLTRRAEGVTLATKLTAEVAQRFAARLEETGSLSEASDYVGISRQAAYDLRCKDPEFDAACRQALERATDRLERKVRERAENGSAKGVWYKGERVGEEIEHHDTLSIFMLKAHRPDVYRPDVAVAVGVGLSVESTAKLTDAELELLVARQLKRDKVIDSDNLNNLEQLAIDSRNVDNSAEQLELSAKGPNGTKGGGGGLAAGTRRGPKHQHERASKRRSAKPPRK